MQTSTAAKRAYEGSVLTISYAFLGLICLMLPLLLLSSTRLIPTAFLAVIYGGYIGRWTGLSSKPWPPRRMWLAFWLIALFMRVDVTFTNLPGPPRFVPYIMGLPRRATIEKARRGEVMLHGCVLNGFEPFYVWVW